MGALVSLFVCLRKLDILLISIKIQFQLLLKLVSEFVRLLSVQAVLLQNPVPVPCTTQLLNGVNGLRSGLAGKPISIY